jgi:ATP-dependent exoDNAse (exonuclease V) beta subunit
VGAFGLFRPGDPNLIIDFKTHDIAPEQVDATARDYRLQALLYRTAAKRLGWDSEIRLHFTRPNQAIAIA